MIAIMLFGELRQVSVDVSSLVARDMTHHSSEYSTRKPRSSTSFSPVSPDNPAGRPKGIEALAREHTPAAIAALVDALRSPQSAPSAAK